MLGGGPLWIGMRLPNSPASSSGAAYRLPLASNVEPTEFTATIAPTTTPLSRTTLAVPSPPFTPPETAPAPAPTLPSWTGPDRAALHAARPKEASGREVNGAPHRPGSKRIALGTIGTTLPPPTGNPTP